MGGKFLARRVTASMTITTLIAASAGAERVERSIIAPHRIDEIADPVAIGARVAGAASGARAFDAASLLRSAEETLQHPAPASNAA